MIPNKLSQPGNSVISMGYSTAPDSAQASSGPFAAPVCLGGFSPTEHTRPAFAERRFGTFCAEMSFLVLTSSYPGENVALNKVRFDTREVAPYNVGKSSRSR